MTDEVERGDGPRHRWARLLEKHSWRPDRRWGWFVGLALLPIIVLFGLGLSYLTPDCEDEGCPSMERLRSYRAPEPPQIFAADGQLAGQLSGPTRTAVELDSVPAIVREGYIAVEDRRFREHGGIDFIGAVRALAHNLGASDVEQGASTITMQLARNVFGSEMMDWNRWRRKLSELHLARKLEAQLTKDEILELYLNQIYLGDGLYGVGTASRHYFGTPISQVTTRQAALLVGLAKNPEGYNPRRNPERAEQRIATVLSILGGEGLLSGAGLQEAWDDELNLMDKPARAGWGANAYYLSAVSRELRDIYPDPADRQGLRVYTGLDARAQAAAVAALQDQIRAIESGRWGTFRHETPVGDSPPRGRATSPYLQGMVVGMRPDDGLVTTLVGGRDYDHSEFDRAFQAELQPGSTFKPIVYATAIAGGLELNQRISTEPIRLVQRGSADWEPGGHAPGALTVREAVVHSSNAAAVRVGERVGMKAVARQARAMGIESDLPPYPSMYLGSGEVAPVELVAAYATFVNGGHVVEPYLITRIEDPKGREVYGHRPTRGRQAIDPRVAFLVLDMMTDAVTRGTGWRVRQSGFPHPAAGKTGTTNESKDVWFIGMTPKLVAGVWLGFDDPATIVSGGSGGDLAAPVWATFMEVANRDLGPMDPWRAPSGVSRVRVATGVGYGGFIVPEDCPLPPGADVRMEYFLSGSEPAEHCLHIPPLRARHPDRSGYEDRVRRSEQDSLRDQGGIRRTLFWGGGEGPGNVGERGLVPLQPGDTLRLLSPLDTTRSAPPDPTRPDTIGGGPGPARRVPLTPGEHPA